MNWSPLEYKKAAVTAHESAQELLARLEWMMLKPKVIVDAGCGTGETSLHLQTRYPDARVLSIDSSDAMVQQAKQHSAFCIQSNAEKLPLPHQSVDLIFANFLLPWCSDVTALFKEWRRVLRPEGMILFSALGPDTLKEWQSILHDIIVPAQMDMHDIGDLLQAEFSDPVLEVNYYTVTYRNLTKLSQELYDSGMLTSPALISSNDTALTEEKSWAVTWEIIIAHAFAGENKTNTTSKGEVLIPLSQLRKRFK